jgi:hypothetical protein
MPAGRAATRLDLSGQTPPDCDAGGQQGPLVLFIATLLVTAAAATAQAPAIADPVVGSVPIERRVAATVLPAELSLIGIIDAFEEAARRLVLQAKGASPSSSRPMSSSGSDRARSRRPSSPRTVAGAPRSGSRSQAGGAPRTGS